MERGRPKSRNPVKTRWNPESERITFPALPLLLPSTQISEDLLQQYLRIVQIEELTRKLRNNEYVPREERSESPEPVYGSDGKRLNTREQRYKEKLEMERHVLIRQVRKFDPNYRPPADYRQPLRLNEKLYIPAQDFPDINFIGLLIGPRGKYLKKIESDSGGARISIRGKGAMKEGKRDARPQPYDNEDLHAVVGADSEDKVARAVEMINEIIEEACATPEAQNELKIRQLKELAIMNGTLRGDEDSLFVCQNCGESGHQRFECTRQLNVTSTLICKICGGAGHISSDCRLRNDPEALRAAELREKQIDSDYAMFMAEIAGNGGEPSTSASPINTGAIVSGANNASVVGGFNGVDQMHVGGVEGSVGVKTDIPPWIQHQQQREFNFKHRGTTLSANSERSSYQHENSANSFSSFHQRDNFDDSVKSDNQYGGGGGQGLLSQGFYPR